MRCLSKRTSRDFIHCFANGHSEHDVTLYFNYVRDFLVSCWIDRSDVKYMFDELIEKNILVDDSVFFAMCKFFGIEMCFECNFDLSPPLINQGLEEFKHRPDMLYKFTSKIFEISRHKHISEYLHGTK